MLLAILTAFLRPAIHSISCIVDSHFSNNLFKRPTTLIFYSTAITPIFSIPLIFLFGTPEIPPIEIVPLILAIGAIEVMYQIPYYKALKKLDTSIIVSLFSLSRILIPVLAFFMVGERLSIVQYIGFFLIIAATFIMSISRKDRKFKLSAAFWMMALVALILAFANIFEKMTLEKISWFSLAFWYMLTATGLSWLFLIGRESRRDIVASFGTFRKNFKLFMMTEYFNAAALFAGLYALSILPVTVRSSISSTQPMFTLFFGWLFKKIGYARHIKEEISKRDLIKKILGYITIIIGVVMIIANM